LFYCMALSKGHEGAYVSCFCPSFGAWLSDFWNSGFAYVSPEFLCLIFSGIHSVCMLMWWHLSLM
jgi:hypothetical protein